jgi:hypothetical protein
MNRNEVFAAIFIAVFFMIFFAAIGADMKQQHACDTACAPSRAITPVVGGQNICLCDEGQGKWRRQELAD